MVERRPVLLLSIQEPWCSLFITESRALTLAGTCSTEITGYESQVRGELNLGEFQG